MSLFDAPPGTLMSPIAVQADTSLGSVVIRRLYEASAGAAVLTQAPRIGASARARLTERRRRLDGITLRSGPARGKGYPGGHRPCIGMFPYAGSPWDHR